jgi:hypothetical protein
MKILDSLRGLYLNLFEHTDVAHFYGYIEIETLDTFYLEKKSYFVINQWRNGLYYRALLMKDLFSLSILSQDHKM